MSNYMGLLSNAYRRSRSINDIPWVTHLPRLDIAPRMELLGESAVLYWGDEKVVIPPRLKHGVLFLMSGYIGSQIHGCEYRIHLDYLRGGRVVNEGVIDGLQEHSRQLGVDEDGLGLELGWNPVIVNRGDEGVYFFNSKMRNWIGYADFSKSFIQEVSLVMVRRDVPILGLPDLVINLDNKPAYIIELKTTGNPANLRVVRGGREALQAESYFHMMSYLGGLNPRGVAVVKVVRGSEFRVINNVNEIVRHLEGGEDFVRLTKHATLHRIGVRGGLTNSLGMWITPLITGLGLGTRDHHRAGLMLRL
ncbi:hypothetical protein [Vulcanisaeta distributa]|uniref:hypothetical protein n=1 Tax=Vulcanisaeta distributa TaxID=164451 RepID=UPI000ABF9C8C|nr:hypothetical protein [Vulcanisaeta distributa]